MTREELSNRGLTKKAEDLINYRAGVMTNMFRDKENPISREEYENRARQIMFNTLSDKPSIKC